MPSTLNSRIDVPSSSTRCGHQVRRVGDGVDERQQAGERLVGVGGPREQRGERFCALPQTAEPGDGAVAVAEADAHEVAGGDHRPLSAHRVNLVA